MVATSMPGQRTVSQCEVSKSNDLSSLDANGRREVRDVLACSRRQQSAPRSLEAHLAPAALARELGEQG